MRFFLANCTSQVQRFLYRLPERKGAANMIDVQIGGQTPVGGPNLSQYDIDALIEQAERYGCRKSADMGHYALGLYVPMLYSVDAPVAHDTMLRIIEMNAGILRVRGRKTREEAAIAASHGMRELTPQAANIVALSVEEEKPGTMDHGGQQGIAEGYRMSVDETPNA